jgi:hypothetical protein
MKLEFSGQIFKRYSNIKLHEYPSSDSQVVACGRAELKIIVAFRNFTNALLKNEPDLQYIESCFSKT